MTVTDSPASVVLTGPTGGLGKALVGPLARRRPAQLILVGRSAAAMAAAAKRATADGARSVRLVEADLADLEAVAHAGRAISDLAVETGAPVTSLVLNAGVQPPDRRRTSAQGLELAFAVNVVAEHLLLETTLDATGPGARAVLVSSGTHFGDWHSYGMVPRPVWQDPAVLARPDAADAPIDRTSGGRAYATSKLAVVLLAHAWQARHGDRLRVNAFDPGLMPGTGLARNLAGAPLWVWLHVLPAFTFLPGWSTPARSAGQLAALALGEAHPELAGGYVEMGTVRRSSAASYDTGREQRLWEVLEELVRPYAG